VVVGSLKRSLSFANARFKDAIDLGERGGNGQYLAQGWNLALTKAGSRVRQADLACSLQSSSHPSRTLCSFCIKLVLRFVSHVVNVLRRKLARPRGLPSESTQMRASKL